MYSFNDYFNWNDGEKDAIKDVMSRFAVETYEGKDGKTYNVRSHTRNTTMPQRQFIGEHARVQEALSDIVNKNLQKMSEQLAKQFNLGLKK